MESEHQNLSGFPTEQEVDGELISQHDSTGVSEIRNEDWCNVDSVTNAFVESINKEYHNVII